MDKKIIFFDIDGTIYKFNWGIPKDTLKAIKQLKNNGHIPVICTGRTRCMIYKEHLSPGFENIVAGAGTYVEINGRQRYLAEMEEEETRRVIDGFLRNKFVPVAEGRDNIYLGTDYGDLTDNNKHVLKSYQANMGDLLLDINESNLKVSKISAMFTNNSNSQNMINEFKDDYSIINHNNNLMEMIPKGYNKAKGIEIMIHELNISREDTYAFGDSFNDIDMLEYVKYGCAMGNSEEEIKKRVKYVTEDFDKGGISKALKRFGLI